MKRIVVLVLLLAELLASGCGSTDGAGRSAAAGSGRAAESAASSESEDAVSSPQGGQDAGEATSIVSQMMMEEIRELGVRKRGQTRAVVNALVATCGGPMGLWVQEVRTLRQHKRQFLQERAANPTPARRQRLTQLIQARTQAIGSYLYAIGEQINMCLARLNTDINSFRSAVVQARASNQAQRQNLRVAAQKVAERKATQKQRVVWARAKTGTFNLSYDSLPAQTQELLAACGGRATAPLRKSCFRAVLISYGNQLLSGGTPAADPGVQGVANAVVKLIPGANFDDLPALPLPDDILAQFPDIGAFEQQLNDALATLDAEAADAETAFTEATQQISAFQEPADPVDQQP